MSNATQPAVNVTSQYIGQSIVITTPKEVSSYRHTLRYKIGIATGTIQEDVVNQKTWEIPMMLCNQLPDSTSGTLRIYCDTYNGTELIGTKYVDLKVIVPDDALPSILWINTNELEISNDLGVFVKNISKVGVEAKVIGSYSSQIVSITSTFNGVTYKGDTFNLGTVKQSGTITMKVIDTRGRSSTQTRTVTVIDYFIPKITNFSVERCDSDGTPNPQGNNVKVYYTANIAPINNLNAKSFIVSYKTGNEAYTTLVTLTDSYTQDSFYISTQKFDINTSYDFMITVKDTFNERVQKILLSSDSDTILDIKYNGKGIAFGMVAEEDNKVVSAWEIENVSDTEWSNISLASNFKAYDTAQTPQYRVKLGTVELRGAISPLTGFASNATRVTFGNIPSQFAPSKDIYIVCQGSGKNTWLLTITTLGELQISRYGITAYAQVETTAWLTFQATYTIK